MADKKKNLSEYDVNSIPDATDMSFVIIVSEWNSEITFKLRDGAIKTLKENGTPENEIHVKYVPGSFELPQAAKLVADNLYVDAIICIGCVIQGETRHFEFINNAVANGITKVGIESQIPVIYGVLTPDNWEQAKERAGGKHGNKGVEAAITAIKMAALRIELEELYEDEDEDNWLDGFYDEGEDDHDTFSPNDELDDDFDDDADNNNDITKLN